ncbi:MAG: hypothetical protein Q8L54_14565 [Devosia sp.]|nr:hypothetical protein [Devosia sp.]
MANSPKTFIDELVSAGRGVLALILGDRKAGSYFNLTLHGLTGSTIAFLAVNALMAYAPALLRGSPHGGVGIGLLTSLALAAIPVALAALVLRQFQRLDGFVPFLVADLWGNSFLSVGMALLLLAGLPFELTVIGLGIVVLIVEINIARLIVTLPPLQIATFVIAQFAGGLVGVMLLAMLLGGPADAPVPA